MLAVNKSKLVLLAALLIASSMLALVYYPSSQFFGSGSIIPNRPSRSTSRPVSQSCNSSAGADGGFVTASFSQCYGLGNVLWRYASLRAIATQLNRTAYFPPLPCLEAYIEELEEVFPNFSKEILLMVSKNALSCPGWGLFSIWRALIPPC